MIDRAGRLAVVLSILTFTAMTQAFAAERNDTGDINPFAGNLHAALEGANIFGRFCQACHNTRGHGGKSPQLVRGAWGPGGANSDALMFEIIANGRPNTQMGSFSGALSAEEIWKVVTFLRAEAVRVQAAEAATPDNPEEDLWY